LAGFDQISSKVLCVFKKTDLSSTGEGTFELSFE